MEYNKKSHCVYLLTYHIVLVTKYRKPLTSIEMEEFVKDRIAYLCKNAGGEMISAEADRNHIHMLVSLPPQKSPGGFVRVVKTQISRDIRKNQTFCRCLKQGYYSDSPLWSPSYFVASTGCAVMEKVKDYILSQKTKEHQSKYLKRSK